MTDTVQYAELHPQEFEQRVNESPIAYLPLGTLEWHGKHLPYGTDALLSTGFFVRLADHIGGVVLPPLFLGPDRMETVDNEEFYGMDIFGFRGEMPQQLRGSAYWIPDDLFERIVAVILAQLRRTGFEVVVAHGHGPSTTFFKEYALAWEEQFDLELLTCRRDDDEAGLQIDHAAVNETSLLQALRPELVELDRLPAIDERWPTGVDGDDPRRHASTERGERIVEREVNRMTALLDKAVADS